MIFMFAKSKIYYFIFKLHLFAFNEGPNLNSSDFRCEKPQKKKHEVIVNMI